jgi:hypothetical protein
VKLGAAGRVVQHPDPSFQLGLFAPGPPTLDAGTTPALRALGSSCRITAAIGGTALTARAIARTDKSSEGA